MTKMNIEYWKIGDVKPYENNPRINDDAVDATANSIKQFGWKQPIVVDKDGVIIVGHTRLRAAEKLGCRTVPVVVANDLSYKKADAYRLADNKTGELSSWDNDLLEQELDGISGIDMSDFGFEGPQVEEEIPEDSVDTEETFQLTVNFNSEDELAKAYKKLSADGYNCKLSSF